MAGKVSESGSLADGADWRHLDDLLAATAAAAKSATDAQAFYGTLLDNALQALDGVAGSAWQVRSDGVTPICERRHEDDSSLAPFATWDTRLVASLARQDQGELLRARGRTAAGDSNPLDLPLLFSPVKDDDGQTLTVIALALRPRSTASGAESALEVIAAFGELAADYHRRDTLRHLRTQHRTRQALEDFAVAVHRAPQVEATAYAIANEGRRLVGCDRVSVVTVRNRQPRTRAVSGVDVLERRGATLRTLESLAQGIARSGEPLRLHQGASSGPEDLVEIAESYRDVSQARTLDAWPLFGRPCDETAPPRVMAALVLEWFDAGPAPQEADDATIAAVRRLSESALSSAMSLEAIPWGATWLRIAAKLAPRAERRGARALAIAVVIAALLLLGALVRTELTVSARGRLQPVDRRAIFAPADGVVTDVLVDHGARVEAHQPLLRLENTALALEAARLTGELATAEQQLRSVRAERWSDSPSSEQPRQDASQLAAQEESLVALVASLTAQRQLALQQERDLNVASPIAGSVVTWRVNELLRARPVARGQELLTIANEAGPWMVELDVPDRQVRHILTAQESGQQSLEVAFRLSTDPSAIHTGRLRKVSGATQPHAGEQLTVPVEVDFDPSQVKNLRPGVEVTARVHCGRRAIAYVWLHEVWEWLAARVW